MSITFPRTDMGNTYYTCDMSARELAERIAARAEAVAS